MRFFSIFYNQSQDWPLIFNFLLRNLKVVPLSEPDQVFCTGSGSSFIVFNPGTYIIDQTVSICFQVIPEESPVFTNEYALPHGTAGTFKFSLCKHRGAGKKAKATCKGKSSECRVIEKGV